MSADPTPDEAPLRFPPLGNGMLARIGGADVGGDQVFAAIREHLGTAPIGTVALPSAFMPWLAAAVQTANDQSFRFELRDLHPPQGPEVVDLSTEDGLGRVSGMAMRHGRGTAKLLVLLALDGAGITTVGAPGIKDAAKVQAGTLVVAPAFLHLDVAPAGAPLRCLRTTAEGPAFR
jgi:hypothetical protein